MLMRSARPGFPGKRKAIPVVVNGITYESLRVLSRACGVETETLRQRFTRGLRDGALIAPVRRGRPPGPKRHEVDQPLDIPTAPFAEDRSCLGCQAAFIARAPSAQYCGLDCYVVKHCHRKPPTWSR